MQACHDDFDSNTRKYNPNKGNCLTGDKSELNRPIVICCVMDVDIYPTSGRPGTVFH
jgi:hypothetical protein